MFERLASDWRHVEACYWQLTLKLPAASRSLIKHSVARSYLTPQVSMKASNASSASFLVSAIQMRLDFLLLLDDRLAGFLHHIGEGFQDGGKIGLGTLG